MKTWIYEDFMSGIKVKSEYDGFIFEVKGLDKRKKMLAHLRQCEHGVTDYLINQINAKGVFIINQYRLSHPINEYTKRVKFEKKEIEFAQKRGICIVPTVELYKLIIEKIEKGNKKITRKYIENKMLEADPIIKFDIPDD